METALYVKDPKRAADFYRRVFGFETLMDVERLIALDVGGKSVLLLFKAGTTHFAFSIDSEEVEAWARRLEDEGISLESRVEWPGGAHSLYFRDPDQNLVELMTPGFWRNY